MRSAGRHIPRIGMAAPRWHSLRNNVGIYIRPCLYLLFSFSFFFPFCSSEVVSLDHQPKAVSPASPTEPSRDHRLRQPRHYIHHICFGRPLGYILRQLWFAPGASLSPFLLAHRDRPRLRCSYHDIHRVGSLCRARLRCALPVLPFQSRLQQDGAPSALTHSPLCGPVLQLYLKSVYVRNI